jgi:prepilin-type processing-associated H-X9-DG protein
MSRRQLLVAGIVLAALGVILALGSGLSAAREKARRRVCASTLKSMGVAIHIYAHDNKDRFPASFGMLFPKYVQDGHLFLCPTAERAHVITMDDLPVGTTDASALLTDDYTEYEYVPGLDATLPGTVVLVYERPSNHGGDGSNVLFLDGTVEWLTPAELDERLTTTYGVMRKQGIPVPSTAR